MNAAGVVVHHRENGRRRVVSRTEPVTGLTRPMWTRECSIDMNSVMSPLAKAQVSTTCRPCVFTTLTVSPAVIAKATLCLAAKVVDMSFRHRVSSSCLTSRDRIDQSMTHDDGVSSR